MEGRLTFMIDFEITSKIDAFQDFVQRLKKYTELSKKK